MKIEVRQGEARQILARGQVDGANPRLHLDRALGRDEERVGRMRFHERRRFPDAGMELREALVLLPRLERGTY